MTDRTLDSGYLVLADLSGYTSYVASTELDHAHSVLAELLELIVDRLQPVLQLSKLEGDAVFAYASAANLTRGETLLEAIEVTYLAFRDRVEGIRRRTTCTCNACSAIPTLDLKFIVHFGQYAVQTVGRMTELAGPEVTLLHRLAKNRVTEKTKWQAYTLFTDAALTQLGVKPEGMHHHEETYEHLGTVSVHVLDLRARYKELIDARRVQITAEDADISAAVDYSAPPAVVWEWLNEPMRRDEWMPHASWSAVMRPGGRTGIGARNHCAHGKGEVLVETVVDWRPFDYYTVEYSGPMSSRIIATHYLEPVDGGAGTRLCVRIATEHRLLPRFVSRMFSKGMMNSLAATLENLGRYVADDKSPAACIILPQLART